MSRTRNPALSWGLAGGILNLCGLVLLVVSLAGGVGSWATLAFGGLISAGALCTLISLLISRGVIQRPPSQDTRQ